MEGLSISIDSRAVRKNLSKLGEDLRSSKVSRSLATAAEGTVIPVARANLRKNSSIFEGTTHKSLSTKVMSSGTKTTVKIGTIAVMYGKNIEEGTPAGLSMSAEEVDKITEWARRKLKIQGKKASTIAGWNIAASIQKKGIAAKPFLMPAWATTKDRFFDMFNAKLAASVGL